MILNVLIRVDASPRIGSGHLLRCLCLADSLRTSGASVSFASREMPPYLAMHIVEHGHKLLPLLSRSDADEHLDVKHTIALAGPCDLAVIDHYQLGRGWEREMRRHTRLLAIDDLARRHDCDWLLDQNYHPDPARRYAGKTAEGCVLMLGPRFALLRPEFRNARHQRVIREGKVQRLVVSLGGMDADNITGKVLEAIDLAECEDVSVDVLIGAFQPARAEIEAWCKAWRGRRCYVGADNVAELFVAADLAIGAGGTTTWERCALGLPTLALCVADNQRDLLQHGSRYGFVYAPDIMAQDVKKIALHLRALIENDGLRHHLSRTGYELVDGKGAQRVAAVLCRADIRLRHASRDDARSLYAWRNHPQVRAASRHTGEIDYEQHCRWLDAVLIDPRRHLLIGEREGLAVGVLRFDVNPDSAEVSIYVLPGRFGRGEGASLLLAGEAWLRAEQPDVRQLSAWVNAGNIASERLFERCGYDKQASRYMKGLYP